MAFPTVAGTNTGGLTTAGTSFAPTRDAAPSADDIELLFVGWGAAGQSDPFASTVPSGWTQFLWEDRNLGATQGGAWYWRRATGSEGTTAIGTFNGIAVSTKLAWIYYRISGAHTTTAPEGTDTQSGGNVAPPSHTASWGAEDNLWIAGVAMGTELSAFSAAPTNYTNLITSNSGSAGAASSNTEQASARRNLAAASDTPDAFTNAASVASVAALVVIRPAGAAGTNLAISDGSHAHAADPPTLTQVHQLAVADGAHAHAADNLTLTSGATNLAISDGSHAHAADGPTLTQVYQLTVADAAHAHAADSLAITQVHQLTIADAAQAHAADNLDLAGGTELVIAEALHGHVADVLGLVQIHELVIAEALHGHVADVLGLVQIHELVIAEAAHAHTSGTLTFAAPLIVSREGPEPGGAAAGELLTVSREGARSGGAPSGPVRVQSRKA